MQTLFENLEICLDWSEDAAEPAQRAMIFAATLAKAQGATLLRHPTCPLPTSAAYATAGAQIGDPNAWSKQGSGPRIVLRISEVAQQPGIAGVCLTMASWHSEATLFAASGLADLNGAPQDTPLVPCANYAAHTIGYAVYSALVGVYASAERLGRAEQAQVDGLSVLKWINWKAVAGAAAGMTVTRTGAMAEWPVLPCADGYVAILFTERDWRAMVDMVADPELADPKFATFQGREAHRADYLPILQRWCASRTKNQIRDEMARFEIPGDVIRTISDLLECPLFAHRNAFETRGMGRTPRLPERIVQRTPKADARIRPQTKACGDLPLSGLRVLDLGIITAGAGLGAMLADMGAEVLKIESETYPDPFRQWAGSSDSPLFRFNNRNKYGVGIDLKTETGKARFLDLVAGADVVVENFRRGVMERLGLGFDTLRKANPAILLASVSGQGHDGPGTQSSTFGSTLEANAGFATLTRDAAGQPYVTGRPLNFPDQVICLYGAGLTAAAALTCTRTGQGMHLDLSQRDTVLYQIGDVIDHVSRGGAETASSLRAGLGLPQTDQILRCADGVYVAISLGETLPVSGCPRDWAAERTAAEVIEQLRAMGGGAAVAVNGAQLARDKTLFATDVFAKDPQGNIVKGFPFQFSGSPMRIFTTAPKVGEHNVRFLESVTA